ASDLWHQRHQARTNGTQHPKKKAGRRATTTGQEAQPPSSRHETGIYFPTSLQHTAHFSHARRLPDREAQLAAAQPPACTERAGPFRRRADRTGRDRPARTAQPTLSGCLQTAPGALQPWLQETPPLPCPRTAVPSSKENSGRTAPGSAPAASVGEGTQGSEASAPIGCVPAGAGTAHPESTNPKARLPSPSRQSEAARATPAPRDSGAPLAGAEGSAGSTRGGRAPPPPPARGLRRCCVTPAQRHLNTGGGAGAARQPPRSGRQKGILGWGEARGWESPLTPTGRARARPETAPSSRGTSRGPAAGGRIGAGGKDGGRGRPGSPTPIPQALRQAPPLRDCPKRGCAPLPCRSADSAAARAGARGRQGHPLRRRPGPPSPPFPRPARAPAAAAAAGGARRFPPPPRASTDLGEGARRSPPREPRPRPPPAGPRQGARADTPRPSVAARRGAARGPITSGCRPGPLPGGGWGRAERRLAGGRSKMAAVPALPVSLSGRFKGSFAYFTIKDRLPQILTRVIDTLHRHKNEFFEEHGEKGVEAEKRAISFLSKLRNELQTDKPVTPLEDELPDAALWNQYLDYQRNLPNGNGEPSWFQSPWLYIECYMYRRIHAALALNPPINNFDVFKEGKAQNFFESQEAVIALCTYFQELLKNIKDLEEKQLQEELLKLLQVSLWGNKCDLSFSAGEDSSQKTSPLQSLENMVPYILVNDMEKVWSLLVNAKKNRTERSNIRVDIILDNAGFELVSDLVLADFLLSSKLADEVYFHGKSIPWYVSDTTKHDFNWTIKQLGSANHMWMSRCGINWEGNLKKGVWVFRDHMFWTLPHDFSSMSEVAPDLYAELQKSNLLLFKGDLNYRKLTGDRKWEYSVPFHQALNKFHPAPLCSLRTLKSDTQVGLKPGQGEQIQASEPEWMVSGKYGVVQFDAGL
uniref:Damage-control phosphatase ARMT1 n=1 Tax=Cyanoderma ruficeps TaxID=181631 RepID=A0A8C3XCU4_9PASS